MKLLAKINLFTCAWSLIPSTCSSTSSGNSSLYFLHHKSYSLYGIQQFWIIPIIMGAHQNFFFFSQKKKKSQVTLELTFPPAVAPFLYSPLLQNLGVTYIYCFQLLPSHSFLNLFQSGFLSHGFTLNCCSQVANDLHVFRYSSQFSHLMLPHQQHLAVDEQWTMIINTWSSYRLFTWLPGYPHSTIPAFLVYWPFFLISFAELLTFRLINLTMHQGSVLEAFSLLTLTPLVILTSFTLLSILQQFTDFYL